MSLSQLWNRLRADFATSLIGRKKDRSRYLTRGTRFRTTADISQQTQKLEQRLMLTSELTEILQFDSLTLTANDVLEIEIGGPVPGNPADVNDNDIDGFDQIIVTGTDGVHLGGLLDVHLVNDYLPAIGTSFRFLSMPSAASLTGRFSNAFGLYAFPSNDRYFDVIVDNVNKELRLEVKALPGGLQFSPPDSQRDAFGRFLSSYFDVSSPTFSCDGSISVAGFATISGTLAFEQSAGETLVVGSGINVELGQDTAEVEITDASFGLVVDVTGYAFEATGTAALTGLSGMSMSGTFYAERSTLSTNLNRTVTVNGQSVSVNVDAGARSFAGENVQLNMTGFANIQGDFAFDVSGSSTIAVASNVTASMQAGAFSVELTDAELGVILTDTDTVALEVRGDFSLIGGDFANASAHLASLRYNTTGQEYSTTDINIGSVTYTFADLPAATDLMVLSATGLTIAVGGFVQLSGDLAFQQSAGEIEVAATNLYATVEAGSGYSAGVAGGTGALILHADGTRQLFASGEFTLTGGNLGQVNGFASVAQNTSNSPVDQRTISVDGITVVLPQMEATQQSISASTSLTIDNFLSISGSVSVAKDTRNLAIAGSNTPVSVEMLTIGGSNIDAFVGTNIGSGNPLGLSLSGVSFGVMLAAPAIQPDGPDQRRWSAVRANAAKAVLTGGTDFTALGTDLSVEINQVSGTLNGNPATSVADFSSTNLSIPTGDDSSVVLDYSSELLTASGTLSLTVSEFLHTEGTFAVRKSSGSLMIADNASPTNVDLLTIGASDVTAFAGVNGGTDNAMGLSLGGVNLAIVIATSKADSSLQWTALKAAAASVAFVGIDGLTMAAADLTVDISRPDKSGNLVDFNTTPLAVPTGPA
ncbi:MAG: hypothetical protein ACK56X_24315, partial [Planctomyces sp.]